MTKLFKLSLLFTLLIIINTNCFSQQDIDPDKWAGAEKTIEYAVPFLTIAPDSRSGAMGDVGVALSPDVNSMHWNPAKYAFIENDMGTAISYTPWLRKLVDDINLAYLSGYKRIDNKQVVAASLIYFSLGEIIFTNDFGDYNGQHTPNEFALDVAYSRKFSDNFSGGVAFRYIRSDITGGAYIGGAESKAGNAVAADVSAYYINDNLNISDNDATLSFGLNISNIGSKISYTGTEKDFLPTNLRLGSALKMKLDNYNSITITADINKFLVPSTPVFAKDSLGNVIYDATDNPV
ncbi:MAG: type IX secretion system outer membrane channel protein PorV, partial [Bacteroidota bacterium]|nr:type IX secretion system outer membrane channel protein PorV [Bacteroidota bacterium]